MEELKILLQKILNKDLQQIILSNSRHPEQTQKVKIRPVLIREELLFQETAYRGTQAFHENFTAEQLTDRICTALQEQFRQGEFSAKTLQATALVSKKGKLTLKVKNSGKAPRTAASEEEELQALAHNRTKHYILEEGKPVDFLVGLGVQTPDGRVTRARFDKFRQINRYLEFIEDVIDELPKDRTIRIIDFGCGKSYLTFAMYYYLHELQHRDIQVTGLDLKTDVIKHCNELAEKLGYDRLKFERGDISTYEGTDVADMVVTLHACDLATDYALDKAVKWGARVILAVPCCQHELNRQIKCDPLKPVLKYGIIKERVAALLTDALRANLLEQQGYETQILEFIDMEHTPKNLLIRAVKKNGMRPKKSADIGTVEELLHVAPTLEKLLNNE
ncbi:MAG: class I SAM-dependent methyltransferase [Waltera sp.]|jgi:SAM-dependent methyltransferase|uniref:class I SAM-dependent methyltransferase n=1 Tax=Waltera sp. TaxID=2815806 RepID=UPI00399B73E3